MVNMMAPGRKVRALDTMHSSGLWLTRINLGCDLKALNVMNNTCFTLGHDLWALDSTNSSELLIISTTRDPISSDLLML